MDAKISKDTRNKTNKPIKYRTISLEESVFFEMNKARHSLEWDMMFSISVSHYIRYLLEHQA